MNRASSVESNAILIFKQDSIHDGFPECIRVSTLQSVIQHCDMKCQHGALHVIPLITFDSYLIFRVVISSLQVLKVRVLMLCK